MTIEIPLGFKKKLARKSAVSQGAILTTIEKLETPLDHPGLNLHKMQGTKGVWEAYVNEGDRLTYHKETDGTIVLRKHCNHDILRSP